MLETFLFPTCFHVSVISQCQYFFANLEMPSVMNKSTGTFLFETPLLFLFKQVLHVEAAFLSPVCSGHITKSGTDGHQGTLTIRESADGPGSSLNLTIYPFNEVGRSDLIPMLARVSSIPVSIFFSAAVNFISRSYCTTACAFIRAASLFSWAWIALSILFTTDIFPRGMTENILQEKCTVQRCFGQDL